MGEGREPGRHRADDEGQVSEVTGLDEDGPEPIKPGDATAGNPSDESGEAHEGAAGPDAIPEELAEESDRLDT